MPQHVLRQDVHASQHKRRTMCPHFVLAPIVAKLEMPISVVVPVPEPWPTPDPIAGTDALPELRAIQRYDLVVLHDEGIRRRPRDLRTWLHRVELPLCCWWTRRESNPDPERFRLKFYVRILEPPGRNVGLSADAGFFIESRSEGY